MSIRLKKNARPEGTLSYTEFKQHIEDGKYWGAPKECFEVEGNKVYLKSHIASQLPWQIDGELREQYNIACLGGRFSFKGKEYSVNPGFWCSYVRKENVRE